MGDFLACRKKFTMTPPYLYLFKMYCNGENNWPAVHVLLIRNDYPLTSYLQMVGSVAMHGWGGLPFLAGWRLRQKTRIIKVWKNTHNIEYFILGLVWLWGSSCLPWFVPFEELARKEISKDLFIFFLLFWKYISGFFLAYNNIELLTVFVL